jgi:hypothetical protein
VLSKGDGRVRGRRAGDERAKQDEEQAQKHGVCYRTPFAFATAPVPTAPAWLQRAGLGADATGTRAKPRWSEGAVRIGEPKSGVTTHTVTPSRAIFKED